MKCEICGHKILPGQKECTNCGYKLEKETNVSTFSSEARDHRHIHLEERVKKPKSGNEQRIATIVIVVSAILFGGLVFSLLTDIFNPYNEKSFEEALSSDLDDQYHTVQIAYDKRNEVMEYMDKISLYHIYCDEYIREYGDDLEASCDVNGYDDEGVLYTVSLTILQGKQTTLYLSASCRDDNISEEMMNERFPIMKIERFNKLLGYNSTIDELNKIRKDYEDEMIDYQDERIYIFEDFYDQEQIQYTIAAKGYELDFE